MLAITFSTATGEATLERERPVPAPQVGEVLIKVLRAGVCSTDLEICRGYVPGYQGVLGHEFVGTIVGHGPAPSEGEGGTAPLPVGTRVVGEINCNDGHYTCADAIFQRNHAPGRSVLGIISRDGALAQYLTLPAANCHAVPPGLADGEAAFAEPLAAACRVVEQGLPRRPAQDRVAVVGDGKLGLLVAQVLVRHVAAAGGPAVTLIGRHPEKMALVRGKVERVLSEGDGAAVAERLAGQFDLVVEASGSPGGIRTALALCRPLGAVVLKSTVSTLQAGEGPAWSELANDIVVNEKVLLGSRCGPFDAALALMSGDEGVRQLLRAMVSAEVPLARGTDALDAARSKGALKVQVVV